MPRNDIDFIRNRHLSQLGVTPAQLASRNQNRFTASQNQSKDDLVRGGSGEGKVFGYAQYTTDPAASAITDKQTWKRLQKYQPRQGSVSLYTTDRNDATPSAAQRMQGGNMMGYGKMLRNPQFGQMGGMGMGGPMGGPIGFQPGAAPPRGQGLGGMLRGAGNWLKDGVNLGDLAQLAGVGVAGYGALKQSQDMERQREIEEEERRRRREQGNALAPMYMDLLREAGGG